MQFLNKIPTGWQPPHCPNSKCGHHKPLQDGFPFKEDGTFVRKSDNRRIQRYLCLSCERSFSTQTFSVTYWLKNPELVQNVFMKTVGGMANRQIARDLGVNQGTVDRTISRIARHYFLFHHHNAVEKNRLLHLLYDSQAARKDMTELLQMTLVGQTSAVVHSDGHQSYPRANTGDGTWNVGSQVVSGGNI